jgi:hypothetical protein
MSIDWDSLNTFTDWSKTLHELLSQASQAIQSRDIDRKVGVQKELNQFIVHSPNDIARQLDDIASNAVTDIFNATFEDALSSIASRTSELTIHTKTVLAATKEAEKAAKSIRLETATKVIHSATEAVRDLASLRTAVSGTANEQALSTKIDRAVKSINDLVPLVMAVRGDD